jgi:hypothetical protein
MRHGRKGGSYLQIRQVAHCSGLWC